MALNDCGIKSWASGASQSGALGLYGFEEAVKEDAFVTVIGLEAIHLQ